MADRELIDAVARAAQHECRATVELLALLAEFDARRLYLGEGCSSLFTYCTQVLHLSEHAGYHRIEAARTARRFPLVLNLIADGALTLTTVAMLRPHLTPENHTALLEAARHKSKREVEQQIACLAPKPDVQTVIGRMTANPVAVCHRVDATPIAPQDDRHRPTGSLLPVAVPVSAKSPAAAIAPLTSDRYLLRVTLTANAHAKLRRAQALMRHTIPNGDAAAVLEQALELLVHRLECVKTAKTVRLRTATSTAVAAVTRGRHIPARVKRAVWARDQGRCAFMGRQGRCSETGQLEYHHRLPFARGGPADVANISLRCRAHNRYESEAIFGAWTGHASST